MSEFTSLSADGAKREKEIHKLKKSKGLVQKPHRNIRKVRYRLASGQRPWLRSLITFVVGSLVLSVVTNSTIWSSPGNPLDVRSWGSGLGLNLSTSVKAEEGAVVRNGSYVFSRSAFRSGVSALTGEPTIAVSVAFYNVGTAPIEYPVGKFCLKTKVRHLESTLSTIYDIGDYAPDLVPQPNLQQFEPSWDFVGGGVQGYWPVSPDEEPLEVYYGTCGEPENAKFRFVVGEVVQ